VTDSDHARPHEVRPPAHESALPPGTELGTVFLNYRDLETGVAFYRDALGLVQLRRSDDVAVLGVPGKALVGLVAAPAAPAPGRAPGLYHLALRLPDRPSLGAFLTHATRARVRLQGAADHGVSEAIYLADPEGNGIEVYRDRPRDDWPRRAGELAMGTGPLDAQGLMAAAHDAAAVRDGGADGASMAVRGPGFRAPSGTVLGHVHLRVADLARAERYYRDALGMDVTQADLPGARFLAAGGYHHHIGVNVWETAGASPAAAGAAGLAWFEVIVPDSSARAAVEARLAGAGRVEHHARDGHDGPRTTLFRDADGIAMAIVDGG